MNAPFQRARQMLILLMRRSDLQLSRSEDVGVHNRAPDTKRLPAMARIRSPDASAEMALDRQWT
jgi:hypothetical protein